jgi:two-component system response regulator YesN
MSVRIEEARELLRESNAPVAEICRRVGYNDIKHFTRIFEKSVGVKPGIYRKLYG